ncbi:hypothetical protein MJH12_08465, partial [bacterium]|nr:hypothetical protein [bacterium]
MISLTELFDLTLIDSLVSDLSIGSRILATGAINSSLIESYILTSSDFALFILSDSHFQSNTITDGEINNLSISYDLFLTHTLENRHIVAQTITSASMQLSLITSAKIQLRSLSSEDILNFTITDEHLDLSALPRSVFAQSAITSYNVVDDTILESDINDEAILSSHIASRAIESDHFADASVLTTHIADFTIESSVIASNSISNGSLQTRVSDFSANLTRGFTSLSATNQLTNIQKAVQIQNGKFLIFDKLEGIYELNSASKNTLVKIDSLIPSNQYTKVISKDKKVWVLVDQQKLYLSMNQGYQFSLIQDFGVDIYDFHFEDEFHGVFVSNNQAWMTYDSGLSIRTIRKGDGVSGFRRIFSLNTLQNIWIARNNAGQVNIDYSNTQGGTDFNEYSTINTSKLFYSDFQFQMTSISNGQMILENDYIDTTDNWTTNNQTNGSGAYSNIWMNTSGNNHIAFKNGVASVLPSGIGSPQNGFNGDGVNVIDTIFVDQNTWYLVFTLGGNNEISIAKTINTGVSYDNLVSFGSSDSAESAYSTLHVFGDLFTINNSYRNYLSSDRGETFNAVKRSVHLTHFSDMQFVLPTIAYAFDTNQGQVVKSTSSGSTFVNTFAFAGTKPQLLFVDSNAGMMIDQGNTNVYVTINGFVGQTPHALGYQANTLNYGPSNKTYIGGDNSNYSSIINDLSAPITYQLSSAGVSITAITSDHSSGLWFGGSTGRVFYVTSVGAESKILTNIGEKVQSISAISNEILLVAASGANTIITFDGGNTWEKVLDSSYDSQLFTACHLADDKSVFLAGGSSILISKLGEGFEEQKIADRTILAASFTDQFDQSYFFTNSISGAKLANNSISESSYLTKTLLSSLFATDSITSVNISSDAISTRVIAFESITKDKIRSNSIYGDQKITTDTLTGSDFASLGGIDYPLLQVASFDARLFTTNNANAIEDSDISTDALNTEKLDYFSFHGSKIKSGAITANHIKENSIFGIHFKSNTLDSGDVNSGTFSVSRILPQTITSRHIVDQEIQSDHFALFEYWNDQIDDLSIQESSLLSDSFSGKKFKTRAFVKTKIKDNSIIHQNILDESIEASKIMTESIELADFELYSLTNNVIKSGTINAALLSTDSIVGEFVVSYDIETSKINSQAISGIHLVDGVITNDKIAIDTIQAIDISATTLTQSKIKTLTLTDGHFQNLTQASFVSDSIDFTKARLYQSNAGSLYVTQSNGSENTFAAIGGGITTLQNPSLSPDNSKIAFISSGRIHWADIYLVKIVDTGITYNG